MKSRRTRRKDGLELPAYAAGLANSNVGPTGPGLLEPTQIMTPTIVTSNSSSSTSKTKNDKRIITFPCRLTPGEIPGEHRILSN